MRALASLLVATAVQAGTVEDACKALESKAVDKRFSGARDVLCRGVEIDCASKQEKQCEAAPACFAKRGSGSGPGCVKCTPDMAFWQCERRPKQELAERVLSFQACKARKGQWSDNGQCLVPQGTVIGNAINTGVNLVLKVDGVEVQEGMQRGAFTIFVEAGKPARIEVVDLDAKRSVVRTVTVEDREVLKVDFKF